MTGGQCGSCSQDLVLSNECRMWTCGACGGGPFLCAFPGCGRPYGKKAGCGLTPSPLRRGCYNVAIADCVDLSNVTELQSAMAPSALVKPKVLSGRRVNLRDYPDRQKLSPREWRKKSFQALQRRLKQEWSRTSKEIIEGTWDQTPSDPCEGTEAFWTEVFSRVRRGRSKAATTKEGFMGLNQASD